MKVKAVIRRLEADGWVFVRQESSHQTFKHPIRPEVVTVSGRLNADISPGQLASIKRKAGW